MKRGRKPTRKQKEFLSSKKLCFGNLLVTRDTSGYMNVINKFSLKVRRLIK